MSLTGALQIGRTSLLANQTAMEVVGNNLANAATEGYTRQNVSLSPTSPIELQPGMFIGMGVKIQAITRATDEALMARLRSAVSDHQAAQTEHELLTQIESIYSELSDYGMSSHLNDFFDAWSELANNPTDPSMRVLVVEQGQSLSAFVERINEELLQLREQVDGQIQTAANAANELLEKIATLNDQIIAAEQGAGGANNLRDERDILVGQLAEYVDVSTVVQENGAMDVFIGSMPVVLNTVNRGLKVDYTTENGNLEIRLRLADNGNDLQPQAGRLGMLFEARTSVVTESVDALDGFVKQMIYQVNRLHSQGQGTRDFDTLTGRFEVDDTTVALNSDDANLSFKPGHGSFQIHVTQQSTDSRVSEQINVDLDGIGVDTSLDDLVAAIDAVANVSASVTSDGRVKITADSADYRFSFSEDSSGALAALGINTFFDGADAGHMAVNADLVAQPEMVAAGSDHIAGDNSTALAIANLQDQPLESLENMSLREYWSRYIESLAIRTSGAKQDTEATNVIIESLSAQREAISGVNIDEEAINLLAYQRAYQGAARFISVVDQMMQTLLNMV